VHKSTKNRKAEYAISHQKCISKSPSVLNERYEGGIKRAVSSSKRSVNPDPSPDPPEPSGVVVGAIVVVVVLFFGTKYAKKFFFKYILNKHTPARFL